MLLKARLLGVVPVAGLDEESLLVEGEIDLVVTTGGSILTWGVAETILGTEFFGDLVVDLGYSLIFLTSKSRPPVSWAMRSRFFLPSILLGRLG